MYGLWHILQHSVENTHALTFQLILLPCFSGACDNVCSEPQNAVSLAVGTVKEDREPKAYINNNNNNNNNIFIYTFKN